MLLEQPVLHALYTVCHEPCGAMVATREMGEEKVIALGPHLVSLG